MSWAELAITFRPREKVHETLTTQLKPDATPAPMKVKDVTLHNVHIDEEELIILTHTLKCVIKPANLSSLILFKK